MSLQISVIVPTYNRGSQLRATLESILRQTLQPQEVIVVDDGSTDCTEEVVRAFGPPVKYLRTKNSGVCAARNAGVAASCSPWLAFCDHDDLWLPNRLQLQACLTQQIKDIEYVFTNFRLITNGCWSAETKFDSLPANFWNLKKRVIEDKFLILEVPLFENLFFNQPIFPSTVLITRSLFDRLGGFNSSLGRNPSEDLEFTLRCVNNLPIGVVLEAVVGITKHEANFSGNTLKNKIGEVEILELVKATHNLDPAQLTLVDNQLVSRRCHVISHAFSAGEPQIVLKNFKALPISAITAKMYIKALLSYFPAGLRLYKMILS